MARVLDTARVRVEADVRAGEREAAQAGERFGRAFAEGADREASRSDVAAVLATEVEAATERVVRARRTEIAAVDQVIDADRRLTTERAKGTDRTDALVAAENDLDAALRGLSNAQNTTESETKRLTQAQSALTGELNRSEKSTSGLSGAMQRLQRDTNSVDFTKLISGANNSGGAFDGFAGKLTLLAGAAKGLGLILKPNIYAELIPVVLGATAAVVEMSGALLLLPGIITTAGLALGAIKIATSGFGDALKNMGDPAKFAEAIAKLTPSARDAAIAVQGLKGRFDELKNSLQEKLFSGLATEITQTGRTMMDVLQPAMESITRSANTMVKGLLQDFRSLRGQKVFTEIGTEGSRAFDNITKTIRPLVQAFLDVASVGAKVLADITGGAGAVTQRFAEWVAQLKESGKLEEVMLRGVEAVKKLGTAAGNVFGIISSVMKASGADGQTFLDRLVQITGKVNEFFKSTQGQFALGVFFDLVAAIQVVVAELKPLGPAVLATMGSVTRALQTASPFVTPLAAAFGDLVIAIQPLIGLAGTLAAAVLSGITVVFRDLKPIIDALVIGIQGFVTNALPGLKTGFSAAWVVAKPLLGVLAELALVVLPPLGTALGVVAAVLGPLLPLIIGAKVATVAWTAAIGVAKATMVLFGPALGVLGFAFDVLTGKFATTAVAAKLHAASTAAAWVGAKVAMVASAVAQGAVWLATMIVNFAKAAASAVAQAAVTAAAWVGAGIAMVASQIAHGAIFLAGWIATGVAAAVSAVLQSGIAVAAWRAAGIAMAAAAGPFGVAILGIAALATLLILNWDSVKTFFTTTLPNGVRAGIDAIVGFLGTTLPNGVRAGIDSAVRIAADGSNRLEQGVRSGIDRAVQAATTGSDTIADRVRNGIDRAAGAAQTGSTNISNAVRSGIDQAVQFAQQLPGRLANLGNQMVGIGQGIIDGIGRGISAGWSYLTGLVSNLAQSLFNAAKAALGIGSPSKAFATIGDNVGAGLVRGLDRVTPKAVRAAQRMAAAVTRSAQVNAGVTSPQITAPVTSGIQSAMAAAERIRARIEGGDLEGGVREAVSIVQNIYNPSVTDAIDSSNRELRRFAAMGGFR